MAILLSPVPKQQFCDGNGDPLVGGKLYTYAAGTLNPATTYTDKDGNENPNPIILDGDGRADIWLSDNVSYKFALFAVVDGVEVEVFTTDNITYPTTGGGGGGGGDGALRAGNQSIGNGDDNVEIVFSSPVDDTTYRINIGLVNLIDTDPMFLLYQINEKTVNGFKMKLNAPADSANYRVEYSIHENA